MIGFVKGTIEEKLDDSLIIENNGIGWQVFVTGSLLGTDVRIGDEVKLYTHFHVREDIMQLYGFFSRDELEIFRMLMNVSGIGPKVALGVLSALSADDIRFAVLAEDAGRLSAAPGIGKKTAQKLILELKDKFQLDEAFEKKLAHTSGMEEITHGEAGEGAEADAVQALVSLGYSGTEALQAVRKVHADASMDSEDILKAALKHIF